MTTVVSGGCGFVGLAVVEALLAAGERVTIVDCAPLPPVAQASFAQLPGALTVTQADVRDAAAMAAALQGCRRLVVGAAITCGPLRERQAPEQVVDVNVGAVATAVRLAAAAGVGRVVHLSSVAVYGAGPDDGGLLVEDRPCTPQTLYGITKLAGEAVALRLAALTGLDLVAARLGACFGPWEHDTGMRDTLSPQHQALAAVYRGDAVMLDRDATRDWLYVRDAAAAIVALLDAKGLRHRVYNVGSGASYPLSDWCAALGHARPGIGGPDVNVRSWADRPAQAIARLIADTGFRPRFGAVDAAADWRSMLEATGPGALASRTAQSAQ